MKNNPLVLIVEDEAGICNFISAILTSNHYQIIKTAKGAEAISIVASHSPDLILLDLGLPDIDGLEVLKAIREWSEVPIIVVSARGHEREKVQALDLGADDYITKPFGTSELLARIRTALRRNRKSLEGSNHIFKRFLVGELEIDFEKRIVLINDKEVHFTPIEYKIITLLAEHAGRVLIHDYIIKKIWGPYANETQALRVNMANIRRKLESNPAEPKYILTEVGVGYRMIEEL